MASKVDKVFVQFPDNPVGRVVSGSLYTAQTTNMKGEPLVYKSGPNKGQPRTEYYFAIAVPKNPGEQHWSQTAWGAKIWQVAFQSFPQHMDLFIKGQGRPLSFKVEDGDDAVPNMDRKGKRNCDQEGWAGCWIIKFKGSFAPKIYRQNNGQHEQVLEPDFVKAGYWVEVSFSIESNMDDTKPGLFINHGMVCFRGYDKEIVFGPDAATAFGAAPAALPPGASAVPLAGNVPMPGTPAGVPGVPAANAMQANYPVPGGPGAPAMMPPPVGVPSIPGVPAPAPLATGSVPMPAAPVPTAPVPVTPNPGFLQVPPPAAVPAPPPAASVTAGPRMAPGCQYTYEQLKASNYSDAQMIQAGYMLP